MSSADPWPKVLQGDPKTKICEACEHSVLLGCGCRDCDLIQNKHRFYQLVVDGKCPIGKLSLYGEDDSL